MQFQIPIQINIPKRQINYKDKILLIGSCFTEHIGNSLEELKFSVLQNPNGILFDPISVCKSLTSYIYNNNKQYTEADLFQLDEVWHSWQHHSRFSNINKEECLKAINESQTRAYNFLKEADWIIITLGSSFSYRLTNFAVGEKGNSVANCHRAPAQWFDKHLLDIKEIILALDNCMTQLIQFNQKLKMIFTVSPVRHIRDGVVDNNRSKARLIESVHFLVNKFDNAFYFPAYELVVDVLRDYRFYDVDLVHPNYMATEFVLEKFTESFIDEESRRLMEEVKKIIIAAKHKPFHPDTEAHRQFLRTHFEITKTLSEKYSFLDLQKELVYFSSL